MNELCSQVNHCEELLVHLTTKIAPVLSPEGSDGAAKALTPSPCSDLCQQLQLLATRVTNINYGMSDLIRRVEV